MKKVGFGVVAALVVTALFLGSRGGGDVRDSAEDSHRSAGVFPPVSEVEKSGSEIVTSHSLEVSVVWEHSDRPFDDGRVIVTPSRSQEDPMIATVKVGRATLALPSTWTDAEVALEHPEARAEAVLVSLPCREPVRLAAASARFITGVVTSKETGLPVGAGYLRVYTTLLEPPFDTRTTDPGGVYSLAVPGPGEVTVRVVARGFASRRASIRVTEFEESILDLALDSAGSLPLRVVDGAGVPIAGVSIRRSSEGGWNADYFWEEGEAFTKEDGRATFFDLSAHDPHWLVFELDGYESETYRHGRPLEPQGEEPEVTVILKRTPDEEPSRAIFGVVTDESGTPIARAKIRVRSSMDVRFGPEGFENPGVIAETDDSGTYRVEFDDNDETCVVAVASEGHAPILRSGVLSGTLRSPARCDVRLAPGHWLAGTVVDEQARAIEGVRIRVAATNFGSSDAFPETQRIAVTDEQGRFSLAGLASAIEGIDVSAPRGLRANWRRPEEIPVDAEVEFVLVGVGEILGRVVDVDTGAPIPSFSVRSRPGKWGWWDSQEALAFTADDGRFRIEKVRRSDSWAIRIEADGYLVSQTFPVAVSRDGNREREVVFGLERGVEETVRVTEAGSGVPIADAEVVFYEPPSPSQIDWTPAVRRKFLNYQERSTDQGGIAEFPVSRRGIVQVRAPGRRRVTISADARRRLRTPGGVVEVSLGIGEGIRGTLPLEPNRPRPWLHLYRVLGEDLDPRTGTWRTIGSVSLESEISFGWDDLVPGCYVLVMSHGFTKARRVIDLKEGETEELDLSTSESGASLRGRLTDSLGNLVPDCELLLRPARGSPWLEFSGWVSAMNDGRFEFGSLPPGSYTAILRPRVGADHEIGELIIRGNLEQDLIAR